MSIMRDGLGLPRITRATGERLTSGVGRRACTRRAPVGADRGGGVAAALSVAACCSSRSAPSTPTSSPSATRTRASAIEGAAAGHW